MGEFFEKIKSFMHEHPYMFWGIVGLLGLLIVWWLFSSPSTASTAGTDNTAALAGAAAQVNAYNDQLEATQTAAAAQSYGVQQAANVQEAQYSAASSVATAQIAEQATATQEQFAYDTTQSNNNASVSMTQYNDALTALENQDATTLGIVQSNNTAGEYAANQQVYEQSYAQIINSENVANTNYIAFENATQQNTQAGFAADYATTVAAAKK